MNIKNYTSTVSADRSVNLIEHRLIGVGATHIAKVYEGEPKRLKGITFQIPVNGIPLLFKLPAKTDLVFKVLWAEVRKPRPSTKQTIEEQAERTAWKILADWVDVQISMIKLEQAEFIEVFLPYSYDPKKDQTLFERFKENNFKQLTMGMNEK